MLFSHFFVTCPRLEYLSHGFRQLLLYRFTASCNACLWQQLSWASAVIGAIGLIEDALITSQVR